MTVNTLDVPPPYPIPVGRGRWRITLHVREFVTGAGTGGPVLSPGVGWGATIIAELTDARGRHLTRERNRAATFTFTMDGRDPAAVLVKELQHDVYVWRWDEYTGRDVCQGRFVVDHAEDQVHENSHTVTFGCHDYTAMLERRRIAPKPSAAEVVFQNLSQDALTEYLITNYGIVGSSVSTGTNVLMMAYLPLFVVMVNPDGTARTTQGPMRNRTYQIGSEIFDLVANLSACQDGFDFDLLPAPEVPAGLAGPSFGTIPANKDAFRIFYPRQGTVRTDMALVYGSNVASITRTVSSADYANRVWAIGNHANANPNAAQLFVDKYTDTATDSIGGMWMDVYNATDVSTMAHLTDQCVGALDQRSVLIPTYTAQLFAGSYRQDQPRVGDIVQLVVQSGRLNVQENQQVLSIAYSIGEDGDEDVQLELGRLPTKFGGLFRGTRSTLDALNRR